MKKLLIIFAMAILLVTLASSVGEQLAFEPNRNMDFKFYCFDQNETFCASGTKCQISLFYPNNTGLIINKSATRTLNYYNYTANGTGLIGIYTGILDCNSGVNSAGYLSFKFYVGSPSTQVQMYMMITAIIILFLISCLLFLAYLKAENISFKWTFGVLSLIFIMVAFNLISVVIQNEAGSANIRNFFDSFTAIIWIGYWFLGALLCIIWILTFLNTWLLKKNLDTARRFGQVEY